MLRLGKCLRNRYARSRLFNCKVYINKQIYCLSDDVDRELVSGELVLAGMFPPKCRDVWNKCLKWNPLPVHTTATNADPLIAQLKNCPKYNHLLEQFIQSSEHQRELAEYREFFDYLSENTGASINTMSDCYHIYDSLNVEKMHGLR